MMMMRIPARRLSAGGMVRIPARRLTTGNRNVTKAFGVLEAHIGERSPPASPSRIAVEAPSRRAAERRAAAGTVM